MKLVTFLILAIGILVNLGCQNKPTKVYETAETQEKTPLGGLTHVSVQTILLDARSSFDFGLSHIPGSLSLRWDEFTQSADPFRGVLEVDLYFHARRLARMGIGPDTKVIVIGKGLKGNGEEGRVAWTLRYLGVKDVKFANIENFDRRVHRQNSVPPTAQPVWRPQPDETLLITKKDFLEAVKKAKDKDQTAPQFFDVRVDANMEKIPKPLQDLQPMHLAWIDFFKEDNSPRPDIEKRLGDLGLDKNKQIIVLSTRGIEGAGVTLALRDLGYSQAALLSGGYEELSADAPIRHKK